MPLYKSERIEYPVILETNSATILGGDEATALNFLSRDLNAADENLFQTPKPGFGTYREGDTLLIYDTSNGQSLLVRCSRIEQSEGLLNIGFSPVTPDAPVWNNFSSSAEDSRARFAAGARVIKLAPPVTYLFSDQQLLRRTGTGSEEILAKPIADFAVSRNGELFTIKGTLGARSDTEGSANRTVTETFKIEVQADSFINRN